MKSLATLYLQAFNVLTNYVTEILNAYIKSPVTIGGTGWLDFFYFGYTDLTSYLSFIFSIGLFVFIHYLFYRGFKWLIKFVGGIITRC